MSPTLLARLAAKRLETIRWANDYRTPFRFGVVLDARARPSDWYDALTLVRKGF